jgi:hypothetical protein
MPDPIQMSGLDAQTWLRPYLNGASSVTADVSNTSDGSTQIVLTIT